jgi:hypothetical protein
LGRKIVGGPLPIGGVGICRLGPSGLATPITCFAWFTRSTMRWAFEIVGFGAAVFVASSWYALRTLLLASWVSYERTVALVKLAPFAVPTGAVDGKSAVHAPGYAAMTLASSIDGASAIDVDPSMSVGLIARTRDGHGPLPRSDNAPICGETRTEKRSVLVAASTPLGHRTQVICAVIEWFSVACVGGDQKNEMQ